MTGIFEPILLAVVAVALLGALTSLAIGFPRAVRAQRRAALERAEKAALPLPGRRGPPRPATRAAAPARAPAPAPPPVAAPAPPAIAPVPTPRRPDLARGLRKSRVAFIGKLERLLRGRGELDAETLDEVEAILFSADLGVATADRLLAAVRGAASPAEVTATLEKHALEILGALPPAAVELAAPPHVLLVVGVNGSGKTTSIGKLAARYAAQGKRVLVAAGDTYRAAAIEQLAVWAERAGAEIVKGEPGGDPASVAFDAVKAAKGRGVDVVIIDTAGRLQTDKGLMDQLTKIQRVVQKEVPDAPHEVILVLDGNTGQNAIRQAQEFSGSVAVTGILLSKLDGTAKGGVVLGIAQEVGLPVRYVGMGEGVDDLYDFDAAAFVKALFTPTDAEDESAA